MINKYFRQIFGILFVILIFLTILYFIYFIITTINTLKADVAVGIVSAVTTILVAIITIVIGKYYEKKKDVDSHLREKKLAIYENFIKEFINLQSPEGLKDKALISFIKELERKLLIWGGNQSIIAYINWKKHLAAGNPDAKSIFLTEDLIKALRSDLGLSNFRLEKGIFSYFILREAKLFLSAAKDNPNITLEQLSVLENELQSKTTDQQHSAPPKHSKKQRRR